MLCLERFLKAGSVSVDMVKSLWLLDTQISVYSCIQVANVPEMTCNELVF